ncbi:MAG TPA: VanW family protein [Gaiellaceae bacterium]
MPREAPLRTSARTGRRPRARPRWQRPLLAAVVLAALGGLFGLAFAGSPAKIAAGVRIAGVDVGGMSPADARRTLEQRSRALADVPVTFTAGNRRWQLRPRQLGVSVDWKRAVAAAGREGGGIAPFRGFRRIEVRVFGADVAPPVRVYRAALDYELDRFARALDAAPGEAAVRLRGLHPVVVPARAGRRLDRAAAADVVVHALASLTRSPVALPVKVERAVVRANDLAPAVAQVRRALSAPVRLQLGPTRWRLPRWRISELLALPKDGARSVGIGGPAADRWLVRLARQVDRPAADADFAVYSDAVKVVPARPGVTLDVAATRRALLAAVLSPTRRVAQLGVSTKQPKLTTAEAEAMHISGLVASYETFYGGDANRIHNVQLVSHLVDRKLIGPGATFSFNGTTGERNAEKGFLEAPVIIDGELQTGLGGGVCQVSTTVFNAAYEAGLPITARTNHSLYISHYPQGRDATVNYPDTDLKFVNDTGHWLLLRTFVGSSSLVVALFGTPTHRRVETQTAPLVETSPPPVERVRDPSLQKGQKVIDDSGEPARSTSVRRRVYSSSGKLLSDTTWSSSYRAEPEILRVGTKPKPKPKPKPTTTTTTTTTTPARGGRVGRRSVLP